MIVLDASVIVEALLPTAAVSEIERRLLRSGSLHAPYLIDVEAAHVIRRYVLIGEVNEARGRAAIAALIAFPINRYPHDRILARVWALRNNLTAYDATYVALAEALDAPLLTCDRRLAASAGHQARIELI